MFQGCQFREHCPDERLAADAAALELYARFRDIIAMRPPALMFPERLTRLVPRGRTPISRIFRSQLLSYTF